VNRFDRRLRCFGIGLRWLLMPSVLALTFSGCGGPGTDGSSAAVDPKADDRNKQYNNYMMSKSKGKALRSRKD
jgi:hypothetical protein